MTHKNSQLLCVILISVLIASCFGVFLLAPVSEPEGNYMGTRAGGTGSVNVFWAGLNDTKNTNPSLLDTQIDVETPHMFRFEADNSDGWADTEVFITGWYDDGETGSNSVYLDETPAHRNTAFRIKYTASTQDCDVLFPNGDLEFKVLNVKDTVVWNHPTDSGQSHHLVEVRFWLGQQIWSADGSGFANGGSADMHDKTSTLDDAWSWDFNITARDTSDTSAFDTVWGEFGIFKYTNISVSGGISAVAQPGDDDVKTNNSVKITYSSNTMYYVNISIEDPGLQTGGATIPASNVSVMNIHPDANSNNSGIPTRTYFLGPDIDLNIWGGSTPSEMLPAGNGTTTAGPFDSDFNNPVNCTTWLDFWVSVPHGTPLGVYNAPITTTIGYYGYNTQLQHVYNGIYVVDYTDPESTVSEITEEDGVLTINATATDGQTTVASVTLWYRYSEDDEVWGNWTKVGTKTGEPWLWDFEMSDGEGHYEFYTVAEDGGNNLENAPPTADMAYEYSKASFIPAYGNFNNMVIIVLVFTGCALLVRFRKYNNN